MGEPIHEAYDDYEEREDPLEEQVPEIELWEVAAPFAVVIFCGLFVYYAEDISKFISFIVK